jgi:hypothetical protein
LLEHDNRRARATKGDKKYFLMVLVFGLPQRTAKMQRDAKTF